MEGAIFYAHGHPEEICQHALMGARRDDSIAVKEEYMGGLVLFQKKEVIYSETLGVCIVEDIVKLADARKDTYNYYLLRAVSDKTKKAYIPVEHHTVQLRNLITLQEAQALQDAEGFSEKSEQIKSEVAYVIAQSNKKPAKNRTR